MAEHIDRPERPSWRRRLGLLALAVWIPLVIVGIGSLMISHWAPLPAPDVRASSVRGGLAETRALDKTLLAVHVLDVECTCSRRVAEHLMRSERPVGVHEVVVLVGEDGAMAWELRTQGFAIERESSKTAEERFGEFAAPALAVLRAADDEVLYVGGYTDRKQGLDVRDIELIGACLRGESPKPLPILGCGATDALERTLDPLRLKG